MAHTYTDGDGHQCYGYGTTVVYECVSCGRVEVAGHEDDTRQVTITGECPDCEQRRAEEDEAAWRDQTDSLGPREAREDLVLCARCGRPTGRNILVKLCDACEHELDRCYQQWVEDQARVAYERGLLETVQAAFGRGHGH